MDVDVAVVEGHEGLLDRGEPADLLVGDLAAELAGHLLRTSGFPADRLGVAMERYDAMVLALAAAEETSQLYIPGRNFDWFDLAADALGIWVMGRLAVRVAAAKP